MTTDQLVIIQYHLLQIKNILPELKPSEREGVFDKLAEGYCIYCGYELDYTGICHCTNDS